MALTVTSKLTNSTLNPQLIEILQNLENRIDMILYAKVSLSYANDTQLQGYHYFTGYELILVVATIEAQPSTPYNAINRLYVDTKFNGDKTRLQVYAEGPKFVSGHVLKTNVIAIGRPI